eukprot:CAMPEP_0197618406 /NCGR_PEP_ID=MMETSP1326-20131121/61520_1 /TAXON_ID=1155430 /ORGANISM="Genus nov. species nov., Strain RCC2288" /LENGTH=517 /DNA_ID=CAMNT_0043187305 /DNA_START=64 /DNA_END=1617 /DNA_ORIENTATION=-
MDPHTTIDCLLAVRGAPDLTLVFCIQDAADNAPRAVIGAQLTKTVCFLRDIFAPADQPPRTLRDLMRMTVDGALAVVPELANAPERMILADLYEIHGDRSPGARATYHLKRSSVEFLEMMHSLGVEVRLAADLAAAEKAPARNVHVGPPAKIVFGVFPLPPPRGRVQSTNEILMMAPTAFEANLQAAVDNHFMAAAAQVKKGKEAEGEPAPAVEDDSLNKAARRKVLAEYAGLIQMLTREVGARVHLFSHSLQHATPDACFPNNWFSTTQDGVVALYPMKTPNRRAERREDLVDFITNAVGGGGGIGASGGSGTSGAIPNANPRYPRDKLIDLTAEELREDPGPRILEGTGSLVLDNVNKVAYVSLSERADLDLATRWGELMGYTVCAFTSSDAQGRAIYHTNVMMCVGTSAAVVCAEAVKDDAERAKLLASLASTGHEVVEISLEQVGRMAGNMLEVLDGRRGLPVLCMSSQAFDSLHPPQLEAMRRHWAGLHHAPIPTLESIGGGSVRCTMAELF